MYLTLKNIKMFNFFKSPDVEFENPPCITGSLKAHLTSDDWYTQMIDYNKVQTLTEGFSGRIAVLDDTALHSNRYLDGVIEMVYEFTEEKGSSGYHGHHVSGIIASKKHGLFKNNKIGLFKVLSSVNGKGIGRWISAGIDAALAEKYEVINASMGSGINDPKISASVKNFVSNNKRFFVTASGNSARATDYPAALSAIMPGVISVGAVDYVNNKYQIAAFSSFGAVTLVTAGVDILSTFPDHKEEYLSGTSMATPFIAGLIASAKEIYPPFTHDDFHAVAVKCAQKIDNTSVTHQGYGVVDMADFLTEVHKLSKNPIESPKKVLTPKTKWYQKVLSFLEI